MSPILLQAGTDWLKFFEGLSSAGLVAFVVLYVFAKHLPGREQSHRDAMEAARKDYLEHLVGARTDFLATLRDTREAFLLEIDRQRNFFKTSIDRITEALDRQAELLIELEKKSRA